MKKIQISESRLRYIIREELMNEMDLSTGGSDEAAQLLKKAKEAYIQKFGKDGVRKFKNAFTAGKTDTDRISSALEQVGLDADDNVINSIVSRIKRQKQYTHTWGA